MLPLAALCQVWSPSVHTHECLSAQEGRGWAIRELPGLDLCVQGKFSCPAPRGCSSSNLPSCLLCFPDFCLNSQGIPQLLGTPCIVRCLCKPLRCPCAPSGTPVPPQVPLCLPQEPLCSPQVPLCLICSGSRLEGQHLPGHMLTSKWSLRYLHLSPTTQHTRRPCSCHTGPPTCLSSVGRG